MEAEAIELGSIGTRARCQALAVCMGLAVLGCVTGCNRVTLVSGVSPSSIAIGDTDVYFTNAATLPNELDRVPLDGGAKTTIATSTTNMSSLVRFGSSIFWANIGTLPADAGVWQLSLRSGSPVQVSHHGEDLVSNQAVAVYATGNTPADTVTHVLRCPGGREALRHELVCLRLERGFAAPRYGPNYAPQLLSVLTRRRRDERVLHARWWRRRVSSAAQWWSGDDAGRQCGAHHASD